MSNRITAEILAEARQLVALDSPQHGGPYGGYAAQRFMTVMQELIERVEGLERDIVYLSEPAR